MYDQCIDADLRITFAHYEHTQSLANFERQHELLIISILLIKYDFND